jgi:hypothetical protein
MGHSPVVDAHQREMWKRTVGRTRDYEEGRVELGALVGDLRGLFVEADPHATLRSDFESYWAPIDGQYELRFEAWAPPGVANDDDLARLLDDFRDWVSGTVLADPSTDHN